MNMGQIVGPIFFFEPWGGRNRVDAAEISRNQSLSYQKEPCGPESDLTKKTLLPKELLI